jgi:hypothetical protein
MLVALTIGVLLALVAWDARAVLRDWIRDACRHDAPPPPDPLDELAHFWPKPERLVHKKWKP